MPVTITLITPEEMLLKTRELSGKILKLSDLSVTPLAPGETPDARRHQIAKLGKALAEAFLMLDKFLSQFADHIVERHGGDVTADTPTSSEPDPNAN